jgi:hypothetical protein
LVLTCLVPLALWILVSGLDDLFISVAFLLTRHKPFPWPAGPELDHAPERRIAILVPLWREHRVIGQMLEHNLAAIRYSAYDVFVGVYPNDQPTARAVEQAARSHPRVHLVVGPHDGPTSKGDCLNGIYHGMGEYEGLHGVRYDIVMTHDAEDLVHPDSLRLVNWFSRDYAMVQVPVLPLPTPMREPTHGLYCDEFAEFQTKDIPMRQRLGGFLPANGVGTGFARFALEHLAATRGGDFRAAARWPRASISRATSAPPCGSAAAGWPESRCKAGRITVGAAPGRRPIGSGATAKAWWATCFRRLPTCSFWPASGVSRPAPELRGRRPLRPSFPLGSRAYAWSPI